MWVCREKAGEDTVRSRTFASQRERPQEKTNCQLFDFGLPAYRTVKNKFLWFKPPSRGYFVMTVLAN